MFGLVIVKFVTELCSPNPMLLMPAVSLSKGKLIFSFEPVFLFCYTEHRERSPCNKLMMGICEISQNSWNFVSSLKTFDDTKESQLVKSKEAKLNRNVFFERLTCVDR